MITNKRDEQAQGGWEAYYGPNLGYVQEQYERYVNDPESVDETYRKVFQLWGAPPMASAELEPAAAPKSVALDGNRFKIDLAPRVIARALLTLGEEYAGL